MGEVEPLRREAVVTGRGGSHGARIRALEMGAADMATRMSAAESKLNDIHGNTAEILVVVKGAKSIGGFAYRYGPKVATFGAGLLAAAGIGNEKVWSYIGAFFGGS